MSVRSMIRKPTKEEWDALRGTKKGNAKTVKEVVSDNYSGLKDNKSERTPFVKDGIKYPGFDVNYEFTIARIVNGDRPFSDESLRLYEFYYIYIGQKDKDKITSNDEKYRELFPSLPKYKKPRKKDNFILPKSS